MSASQAIQCRGVVCRGPNRPLTIEQVTVDAPKSGEVRVKVAATGICHSDAHLVNGHITASGSFKFKYPSLLGHEGSGVVESVGDGVTSVKKGDKVLLSFHPKCNDCAYCKMPERTNLCCRIPVDAISMVDGSVRQRVTATGEELANFVGLGTLIEYLVVEENRVAKIDDAAPLDKVCLIACGIPTGFGSAVNIAKVQPGATVGIWGLGTIGLAAACGARSRGASLIVGVDTNPAKFELARKFGCNAFINPLDLPEGQTIVDAIKLLTNGVGLDVAIECIGFQKTVADAFQSTALGFGVTVVNGVISNGKPVEIEASELLTGKTLTGGFQGGFQGKNDLPKLVDLYMKGELMVDEFITGTVKLEQVNEAFELLFSGKALRTVVTFD